jgi:hypothetical protein
MKYAKVHIMQKEQDPLNLGSLPLVAPPADDWPEIRNALLKKSRHQQIKRMAGSLLAAAAAITLAIGLFIQQPTSIPEASVTPPTLDSLIALSQQLETGIRDYRSEAGGLPTELVIYQVELEDLIAQVDDELSVFPDSQPLWSQRVNLLLDLSQLYEKQLRRDYHRLASL